MSPTIAQATRPLIAAHASAFSLFAGLLVDGPKVQHVELLCADPQLVEAFAGARSEDLWVEHHALFGFQHPPYAGEFLGAVVEYEPWEGHTDTLRGLRSDHLGVLLARLADRCARWAETYGTARAHHDARQVARLLDLHLVSWLPCYLASATERSRPPWTDMLHLLWALVRSARAIAPHASVLPLNLPAPLELDDHVGLRDIARFLSQPARCGAHLSHDDINEIARHAGIPCSLATRAAMLDSLLRVGLCAASPRPVLTALKAVLRRRRAALTTFALDDVPSERWRPFTERLDHTCRMLDNLDAHAPPNAEAAHEERR